VRRYLIVDDNRPLAENLAEILRDQGDEVVVAEDGSQGLRELALGHFDALLTDMRMPQMDGAELVRQLRQRDPGLPAIMLTAFTGDDVLRRARKDGLLAVLSKPVPLDQLLDLLSQARRAGMVAVVEDDEPLADNLAEALRGRGFTAITANSVDEAKAIGQVEPFAALVDLRLPGAEYGEAMEQIEARFSGVPQVVITAYGEGRLPVAAHSVFKKPFQTEQLLDELEKLYQAKVSHAHG
jgi:two-component system, response regulator PdtaR